jgi:hypothetical protein
MIHPFLRRRQGLVQWDGLSLSVLLKEMKLLSV